MKQTTNNAPIPESCLASVTCCKLTKVSSEEIFEAKLILPIVLSMWTPMAIGVLMSIYYHIRWQYFGITDGINPFYTNKFKTSWDSYLWIASEIGFFGMVLLSFIALGFLWMTRLVIIGLFYSR